MVVVQNRVLLILFISSFGQNSALRNSQRHCSELKK